MDCDGAAQLSSVRCPDSFERVVKVMVMYITREVAYQVKHEFEPIVKHYQDVKTAAVYGSTSIVKDKDIQTIFVDALKKKKQVMTPNATMSVETHGFCQKLLLDPHEIRVDE
eukprot:7511021-Heterocapsa_arctica.AAC.1